MKLVTVASVVLLLAAVGSADDPTCTSVKPADRAECGWPGITPAECNSRDCCFDSTIANVKWCFKHADPTCTAVKPADRAECGWPGITPAECYSRACCFDSTVANVKWCFKHADTTCTSTKPTDRDLCVGGFAGITAAQCHTLGCCFDSSVLNVIWCFKHVTACPEIVFQGGAPGLNAIYADGVTLNKSQTFIVPAGASYISFEASSSSGSPGFPMLAAHADVIVWVACTDERMTGTEWTKRSYSDCLWPLNHAYPFKHPDQVYSELTGYSVVFCRLQLEC